MKNCQLTRVLTCLLLNSCFIETNAQTWSPLNNGVDGTVWAISKYNSSLIIGGDFIHADGLQKNGIATWNGFSWGDLGSGTDASGVRALAEYGGELFASGPFTTAGGVYTGNVAKWNGTVWDSVGIPYSGFDYPTCFAVFNNELYMGGSFSEVGGVPAHNIAKWNGSSWDSLGAGTGGRVRTLTVYDGALYVGGSFTSAGGLSVNGLAKWDGSQWSLFTTGVNGYVNFLFNYGNELYIGGIFSLINGTPAANIAKWDGTQFYALGSGITSPNSEVFCLSAYQGKIYVGGHFTLAGGISTMSLATFDGVNWGALGNIMFDTTCGYVTSLFVDSQNSKLYAGGSFNSAGSVSANNVAVYDLTSGIVQENRSKLIQVYPSLITTTATVYNDINDANSVLILRIFNSNGSIVCNQKLTEKVTSINFINYLTGLYYLSITRNEELVLFEKIIHSY